MSMRIAGVLSFIAVVAAAATGCNTKKDAPKKFGEPCASALDCEGFPQTQCNTARGGICTKKCVADLDCGGDLVCASDATGTSYSCAKKMPGLLATGASCPDDPTQCDHGPCLHKEGDAAGFCSMSCNTTNDCPANYKVCVSVSDSAGQKFCLPGATAASAPPQIGIKKGGGKGAPAKPAAPGKH